MNSARVFFFALCCLMALRVLAFAADAKQSGDSGAATYIGSAACKECHEKEYENFAKYSKKIRSKESVEKMRPKLSKEELEECYSISKLNLL